MSRMRRLESLLSSRGGIGLAIITPGGSNMAYLTGGFREPPPWRGP